MSRTVITREICEKLMHEKVTKKLTYEQLAARHEMSPDTIANAAKRLGLLPTSRPKKGATVKIEAARAVPWRTQAIYVRVSGPGFDEEYAPLARNAAEAAEKVRRQLEHRARHLRMEPGKYRITAGEDAKTVILVELGEVAA